MRCPNGESEMKSASQVTNAYPSLTDTTLTYEPSNTVEGYLLQRVSALRGHFSPDSSQA